MENHLPQSSQHGCQSIIWLINSSCFSPCCLLFLPAVSHSLPLYHSPDCHPSCWVSRSLPICGSLVPIRITLEWQWGWADASSAFWSGGGGTVENSWEKQENIDNDLALTSKQLQLYTFGACCYSAIPGAFLKASGIHSAVGTRLLHPGWCWIEEGGERGRMASVRKHWINC